MSNKIRRFSIKNTAEERFPAIENILDNDLSEAFKEFFKYYASMGLFECVFYNKNGNWEVKEFLKIHWIIVRTKEFIEKGYGKKLFFALNPNNEYFFVSYENQSFGKVFLLKSFVQIIHNGIFARLEKVKEYEGIPKIIKIADSFEEFVNGLEIKKGEIIDGSLQYCNNNEKIDFKYLKKLNIRYRMSEISFIQLEKKLKIGIPNYFKEFMKRYANVGVLEKFFFRENDFVELAGFNGFTIINNVLAVTLEDDKMEKMLPFSSLYGVFPICLSFDEKTYGKVILYDSRYRDFDITPIEVLADSFEDFVNSLTSLSNSQSNNFEIYYCDESLEY